MTIKLTYEFKSDDALRAFLDARSAPADTERAAMTDPTPTPVVAPAEAEVDSDGMPYDPEIHSDARTTNKDGTWKARKGMAEEAKAARAEFKASGGNVEAPVTEAPEAPAAAPGMPGMPGMPGLTKADTPEPVSLDQLIEKTTGMMGRGKLDEASLKELYAKIGVGTDPSVFETNETMRAKMFSELCTIEPELIG